MKMPSVMKHVFSQIPSANIPRSVFDRTHCYKTTFDAGYLIPFYVDEALPGDTFNLKATIFTRLATPAVPFMDNLYIDTFYFAVPLRLIWSNFQKFMGERVDPDDSIDFSTPIMTAPVTTGFVVGELSDYFGLPTGIPGISVCSFWHRAYNLIWNEWFRDENLQDSVVVDKDDGPDTVTDYVLLKRGKRHDYFTSALPWAQKGTGVELPLGTTAPITNVTDDIKVYGNGKTLGLYEGTNNFGLVTGSTGTDVPTHTQNAYNVNVGTGQSQVDPGQYKTIGVVQSGESGIHVVLGSASWTADLSTASASTINALREAFQIQKLLERDARGGTRYTELVRSHFGVVSPDARLQRPEFLGGNSRPIMITPIAQTSSTDATTPQANLAAIGTGSIVGDGFTKSFTEHCVVIGLVMVRADLTYQQGIPRMFSRRTRYDFYWPALANLGEQAVLNKEIYAVSTAAPGDAGDLQNNDVFGYQERWAEYRYFPSKITGKLRSTYATSLDVWHLSQEFTALPTLSPTFIVENPPIGRVIAVQNEPHFIMDSFLECKTVRPMPVYSVPGLIDHF